ncbi:MAG: Uma2 family endonuclease, partial [Saprospiraceae bacterium]
YDRGEKFARYRTLPSFEEYVLVSQSEPRVETFVKKDGKWFLNEDASGLEASVEFVSLGAKIPLSEIYRNISFEEEKPKKRRKG